MSSSMNIEMVEEGAQTTPKPVKKTINWPLTLLSCLLLSIGIIGGPLMMRLYYLRGGKRRWLSTCTQTAGFPIIFPPLIYLFFRSKAQGLPPSKFFMDPLLFVLSGIIGVLLGLDNFMYSLGISYLPVSTSSLLFNTQLAFISIFAWIIVKQKFTSYIINSIVLMTLGSILLGFRTNGDRPAGVSNDQYLAGFFLTLGSAALVGLLWPCIELSYTKSKKPINYTMILQFQLNLAIFATIFSIIGMLINKDFEVMGREARNFDLGHGAYYAILFVTAVVWQCSFIGALGIIFFTSSLFNGILAAVLLPLTEVAAVFAYKERFNGEKGMSLALCLWGFISYFYGEYKNKKVRDTAIEVVDDPSHT